MVQKKQEKSKKKDSTDLDIKQITAERDHLRRERDNQRIVEINKSPLELCKRCENKGYVFVHRNLATVNVELNEFIELMRMYNLPQLNGCIDPDNHDCSFRHRRCRLFMFRKCSLRPDIKFYSPSCNGVTDLTPTNEDIENETELHKFIQLFNAKFYDRVTDLVNYVKYIIDPENAHGYIVDVTMIADPYYQGHTHSKTNGYGKPINNVLESDDPLTTESSDQIPDIDSMGEVVVDTGISARTGLNINKCKCTLNWHQDQFLESSSKKPYAYDFVALFVLNANNVTPHKLMIGKLKRDDLNLNTMDLESLQEHIVPIADTDINDSVCSDLGYIIDQRRDLFHKHSDFVHNDAESRRNVITIRIKYLS